MRKLSWLLFICVITYCSSAKVFKSDSAKIKPGATVAFVQFKTTDLIGSSETYASVANQFIDTINSQLLKTQLKVIERQSITAITKEQELQMTGLIDSDQFNQVGKLLKADYIIVGSGKTKKRGKSIFLKEATLRMVDVTTGQIVLSANFAGAATRTIKAANKIGRKIRKELR